MQLRRRERTMQHRCYDLEGQLPLAPQAAEEVHDDYRLAKGAKSRGYAGEEEQSREEDVAGGVDPV